MQRCAVEAAADQPPAADAGHLGAAEGLELGAFPLPGPAHVLLGHSLGGRL